MPASASLLAASAAIRAASLNLCTDEYLLLIADPGQIVSVSYLARDPRESALWQRARPHAPNRGSLEGVVPLRPNLLLTMGGSGRATQLLARRLDIGVVDLPPPSTISDVRANLERVARALGHADRATPWVRRLTILERTAPRHGTDAMWISGGGISFTPDSLGTQWMRLAGLEQRALQGGRVTLETLLTRPPHVLVRSNYRSRQMSSGERWLDHPVVRRSRAKHVVTDGRPWTCLGPLMIPEIERLRRLVG